MSYVIESVANLNRFYIAKKATQYRLVLREAEPAEVSDVFKIPDSGIPAVNMIAAAYVGSVECKMDDLGLKGLERTAFLGAEALGMHFTQSLTGAFSCLSSSNLSLTAKRMRDEGVVVPYDIFFEGVDVVMHGYLDGDIFRMPDFNDWVKGLMKENIRVNSKIVLLDHIISKRAGPDSVRMFIEYEP